MLRDALQKELQESLKKGDSVRVGTLRFLLSAVSNAAIAKYGNQSEARLTDEDVLDAIKKQVKTHKESIDAFEKAGRAELAQKEKEELAILEVYLPKEISDEEIRKILEPVAASGGEFGPLMGKAMQAVAGKAGGGRVSAILKELLGK